MARRTLHPGTRADVNVRVVKALAQYVEDQHGAPTLEDVAHKAGLTADDLLHGKGWIPLEQFEAVLEGAFDLVGGDEEKFQQACSYGLAQAYGPARFLLWATSPKMVLKQAARTFRFMSSFSHMEVVDEGHDWVRFRYTSSREESRLMCVSRLANAVTLPTLWGLPPAQITEYSCVGQGDASCEVRIQLTEHRHLLPSLIGAATGTACSAAMFLVGMGELVSLMSLPLLGGAVGTVWELRRLHLANLEFRDHSREALNELVSEETEARKELVALHQRQSVWTQMMEDQVDDRTSTLQNVLSKVHKLQEERVLTLQGYSHDLRNPLTVLKSMSSFLRDLYESEHGAAGPVWRGALNDHDQAVIQMERLLVELMDVATSDEGLVKLVPQRLEVTPLTERLGRRLRALVFGRDIRVSIFASREAPDEIETDLMLFNRIIDNLLINAAKYTRRGSIVVEISGTPDFLVIKVSDTGKGISSQDIARIFSPEGPPRDEHGEDSYGLGLNIVVKLLGQIGGKLEVMSRPGMGTTFWVYFPMRIEPLQTVAETGHAAASINGGQVVFIRAADD